MIMVTTGHHAVDDRCIGDWPRRHALPAGFLLGPISIAVFPAAGSEVIHDEARVGVRLVPAGWVDIVTRKRRRRRARDYAQRQDSPAEGGQPVESRHRASPS